MTWSTNVATGILSLLVGDLNSESEPKLASRYYGLYLVNSA